MVCSKVILDGRLLRWLFSSSHTITEESLFHPGSQYGIQQLSSSGLGQCQVIQQLAGGLHAGWCGWVTLRQWMGLFIHIHDYNTGGARCGLFACSQQYTFELLSRNSAAIVTSLCHIITSGLAPAILDWYGHCVRVSVKKVGGSGGMLPQKKFLK